LSQPYGHLMLGVVALGFVALGLHSFAAARWMRLLGSTRPYGTRPKSWSSAGSGRS
jgi:hypothetical protein